MSLSTDLIEAIRGTRRDFSREPIRKSLFLLAVPMVLETSMHSTFAVFDTFLVGRLGPSAVASIGLTEALLSIVFAVAMGLSMGTAATIARRIGEKKAETAVVTAVQAIVLGLLLSVVVGVVGAVNATTMLELMGARHDILAEGSNYAIISFASCGTIFLLFLINAAFRGAGDPSLALRALAVANLANIILDPLLIFGIGPFPALGITGAAVATALGRTLGLIYQVRLLTSGKSRLHLRRRHLKIVGDVMMRLIRVSGMGVLQFFITTSSFTGLVWVITPYSSAALAGYTISLRVILFVLLPAWGLANASATLVGQNLGAGEPDRAEHSVWIAARYNLAFLGFASVLFLFLAQPLLGLFTNSAEAIGYGTQCLRIISCGYLMTAYGMVMMAAFNGSGDTTTPMWINLACHWMVKLPLAWTLTWPLGWGPMGMFVAIPVSEALIAISSLILFRRGKWRTRVI